MSNVYPFDQNYRIPGPPGVTGSDVTVITEVDGNVAVDKANQTTQVELPDGQLQITFGEQKQERKSKEFDDNLAEDLTESELSVIAERLLLGIAQDEMSRDAWLQNMSNGISLLGLEVKNPRGAAASGASPAEGVSTVDHPLLLEAVLRFQANARGELLPTDGPVKVRNDSEGEEWIQRLGQALEKDLNHYLTKVASEYYPDTDRMLFLLGFSGISFKKGYHDPIKRRPVIASIDAKDLIVSNAATNLEGAGRVTHRIMLRPSVLRRMQLLGAYRDVHLPAAGMPQVKNPVDAKIDQIQGVAPATYVEPEDQDRELYECYSEIEVPGFEHKIDGEESGLPLPYKVTLDKDARRILEIRRNWVEDDDLCLPRNRIIAYIFVPGMGFYGIGLLNILGNSTKAVTAAWRLMIDAGMFANFPGFLYLKSLAKQLTNQFRIAPGSGMPIDTVGNDIQKSVMPLPYKDPSAVFIQLIDNIATTAQKVGGTAEMQVGEGKQDAPVGTTLAMIEQATKIMNAVHKRLHYAQSQEFSMLKDLLTEDPSALWRHNKKSKVLKELTAKMGQQPVADALAAASDRHNEMFVAALNDCELIPAADPNTSSQTERYLKITALKQIAASNPNIDADEVDKRALHVLGFDDADSLFRPPPEPGSMPPDPNMMTAQATMMAAQARMLDAQSKQVEATAKTQMLGQQLQAKRDEMASRERIANQQVAREIVIHGSDKEQEATKLGFDAHQRSLDRVHAFAMQHDKHRHSSHEAGLGRAHDAMGTLADMHHRSGEAALGRTHEAHKTIAGMFHKSHEAALGRQHEGVGDAMGLDHEANQADLDRQHQIAMQPEPPPKGSE